MSYMCSNGSDCISLTVVAFIQSPKPYVAQESLLLLYSQKITRKALNGERERVTERTSYDNTLWFTAIHSLIFALSLYKIFRSLWRAPTSFVSWMTGWLAGWKFVKHSTLSSFIVSNPMWSVHSVLFLFRFAFAFVSKAGKQCFVSLCFVWFTIFIYWLCFFLDIGMLAIFLFEAFISTLWNKFA